MWEKVEEAMVKDGSTEARNLAREVCLYSSEKAPGMEAARGRVSLYS